MERTGTITAVSGDTLEVTFCRPGDCEKCHACIGGEKKHVLLVKGEGHVGDVAVVSLPEQTVVKASAFALLCFILQCAGGIGDQPVGNGNIQEGGIRLCSFGKNIV